MNSNIFNFGVPNPAHVTDAYSQRTQFETDLRSKLKAEIDDTKENAFKNLEVMCEQLQKMDPNKTDFVQLWGMVIGRYGSRKYPIFEEALPYLQAGIQLQLQGLGLIPKEDFSKLTTLEDFKKSGLSFDSLNRWLLSTDEKRYPEFLMKLADDEKLTFARNLLTLGFTYSHLPQSIKQQLQLDDKGFVDFKTRFHYGIKELLASMPQTPTIQKELGEIYYNSFPGLYLEKHRLETGKKEDSLEDIEKSFQIRWEAAKYNPALSMQARIHNLKACHLSDFKEKMEEAKGESLKSIKLWEEVLKDSHLTDSDRQLFRKLSLNAKSVYGYILREMGAPLEELDALASTYLEFYELNGDRDPYTMIHLIGLCKLELHKGHKEEVLKWVAVIEQVSQKYKEWPDTVGLLKQAQELKEKAL